MTPDIFIVLSGGTVPNVAAPENKPGAYRSTSYEEGDAFGMLGGIARVQAAALLAHRYPEALLLTSGARNEGEPSHAVIMAKELEVLGVHPDRILLEETSYNTHTQIQETLKMAREHGWRTVVYVTNEYQCARVEALLAMNEQIEGSTVICEAAEPLLIDAVPGFKEHYEQIKSRDSYRERVAAERQGVEAVKNGTYQSASSKDKQERLA